MVVAIKIYMSKDYDIVEWCFLYKLIRKLGFGDKWVTWATFCVTSVTYTVLVNDRAHGFVKPGRGIRQGGQVSLLVLILYMETLVHVLNNAAAKRKLHRVRAESLGLAVHHLLFVDDSLLLCKADREESWEIKRCLQIYGDISGQRIKFQKSSIIFATKVKEDVVIMGSNKE